MKNNKVSKKYASNCGWPGILITEGNFPTTAGSEGKRKKEKRRDDRIMSRLGQKQPKGRQPQSQKKGCQDE